MMWEKKSLGVIADVYNGNSINADYKKKHFLGLADGLPFVATKDVLSNGEIDYNNGVRVPQDAGLKIAPADSVFVCAEGGSAGKKIAYVKEDVCFGNKLFCILPKNKELYSAKYIYYYCRSEYFRAQFFGELAGLIGGVSAKKFRNIECIFPPFPEQERIVALLDAQFAKIDAIKANAEKQLHEARNLLNKTISEYTSYRIGWNKSKLKDVCSIIGEYGLNESATTFNGVRYLRITDITADGELNDEKVSCENSQGKSQKKLEEGDILFARTGATVGKTLVYKNDFGDCNFAGYLIRYRTNPNEILPKYLFYYTHSSRYYEWVDKNQAAAAQPNISAQKYNNFVIEYPSTIEEQIDIVTSLDNLFDKVKFLEYNCQQTVTLCNDLKQSILKDIFG